MFRGLLVGLLSTSVLAASAMAQNTVMVRVTDARTDAPLVGAVVSLGDTTAVSSGTGFVTIRASHAGVFALTVRLLGYRAGRVDGVSVGDSTTHVAMRLLPSVSLLDQVQVTATKDAVTIGDVPELASTVTQEQIDRQGDTRFTQTLNNVPGLINSVLEGQFESVLLRGMPRGDNEWETTLLLIDGVPQTDSRNSSRVINLPLDDISSVEVVRGPNSALYGRTAIGGAVNVHTPQPTADPMFNLDLAGGQFDELRIKAAASGPLGNWGGYYVSAGENQNHGFYQQPFTFNIRDNDQFAKLTFTPDSKSHGSITANYNTSENALPTPLPIIDGRLLSQITPAVGLYRNFNLPTANYHQDEFRSTANYERELASGVTGTAVAGFRHIVYQFQDDGDEVGSPFDTSAHTFTQYPFEETSSSNIYYSELRFDIRKTIAGIENDLLVGASYDYTSGAVTGNLIYTDTTTFGWSLNYLNPVFPDKSTWLYDPFGGNQFTMGVVGLYGQYAITPLTRLTVTLGGRYDNAHLTNLPASGSKLDDHFHAFSPKVNALVRLLGVDTAKTSLVRLNAYATYSEAFVPPRTPSALDPSDSLNLQPEYIHNYEGGLKGEFPAARVSFDAGYFDMRQTGIVVDTRVGPFFEPSNAGEERFRGFEGSVQWSALRSLSLYANAALYHNRFGHFIVQESDGDDTLSGKRLPISPDQVFNAGGTWVIAKRIGLTLNVKHVGDTYIDQNNTFKVQPYTVTDASVFWGTGPVLITLSAHNLFDARYFTNGDSEAAESIDPAPPRQIVLTTHLRLH